MYIRKTNSNICLFVSNTCTLNALSIVAIVHFKSMVIFWSNLRVYFVFFGIPWQRGVNLNKLNSLTSCHIIFQWHALIGLSDLLWSCYTHLTTKKPPSNLSIWEKWIITYFTFNGWVLNLSYFFGTFHRFCQFSIIFVRAFPWHDMAWHCLYRFSSQRT